MHNTQLFMNFEKPNKVIYVQHVYKFTTKKRRPENAKKKTEKRWKALVNLQPIQVFLNLHHFPIFSYLRGNLLEDVSWYCAMLTSGKVVYPPRSADECC